MAGEPGDSVLVQAGVGIRGSDMCLGFRRVVFAAEQRPAFAVHEVGAAGGRGPEAAPSFCCA